MPAYLIQFSESLPICSDRRRRSEADSVLHDEVRFILMQELRDPKHYLSVLQSIAFEDARMQVILFRGQELERGPVSKILLVLQEPRLIERRIPSRSNRKEAESEFIGFRIVSFVSGSVLLNPRNRLVEGGERKASQEEAPHLDKFHRPDL